ncbi:MAG: TerB family tellurite resistance protein [Henriciella sp.]|nr:TerB family tellurite resistance protein [Henriciella sp.]
MNGFFSKLFGGRGEAPVRELDPYEAAAALMIEAALVDGIYANLESDMVAEILVTSFNMDAARADEVLKRGEELAENATDAHALTRHVKKLPDDERTSIIEGLYRVSLADGEACKFEDAYIRHVASLLHIDDVTRAHARKRAGLNAQ